MKKNKSKAKTQATLKKEQMQVAQFQDDKDELAFYQPSEQAEQAALHIDKIPKQEVSLIFFYLIQKLPEKSKIDILQQTLQKLQKSSLIKIFQSICKKFPDLELIKIKLQQKKIPQSLMKKINEMSQKKKKNSQNSKEGEELEQYNQGNTKIQDSNEQSQPDEQQEEDIQNKQNGQLKQNKNNKKPNQKSKFIRKRAKRQQTKEPFSIQAYAHFDNFMISSYRLYPGKKKQNFMRRQPIFERYNTCIKTDCQKQKQLNISVISLGTFRKFMKRYFKKNGMKYQEATNMYKMKVILSIGLKGGGNGQSIV